MKIITLTIIALSFGLISVVNAETLPTAGDISEAGVTTIVVDANSVDEERIEATQRQMTGIWYSMDIARNEAGRISVLNSVARSYWLRTAQAEVLLQVITDAKARAKLLVTFYPRLTNPERFSQLLRLLPKALQEETLQRTRQIVTASL